MNGDSEYCFRNKESLELIRYLFAYTTMNTLNYDIVSNDSIINYTPFFKKHVNVKNIPDNYILFMEKLNELKVDELDSTHYILVNGLLSERRFSCIPRAIDMYGYPAQLEYDMRYERYNINLFKTNLPAMKGYLENINITDCNQIIYNAEYSNFDKVLPIDDINIRFQVLDFYLPLTDVEKLNDVKVFPHKSL
jgi:hypothetical protein